MEILLISKSVSLSELGIWSYLLLAVLVAVEGPIATLVGAGAASIGLMQPVLVFVSACAGNLISDTLWYAIGYAGKIEWLDRFGKRLHIDSARLEHLQHNMHKHAAKILFAAKLSLSLMIPSLITAGLIKVPWRRWFPAVFTGEMIWTGSLVLIGYHSAAALHRVEKGLEYFIVAASILFVGFIFWFARRILTEVISEEEN